MKNFLASSCIWWLNSEYSNVPRTISVIIITEIIMGTRVLKTTVYLRFN
jgi:hypothetical protein